MHDPDVRDRRQVAQGGLARGQQRGGHELEHAVLGADDRHLAGQPGTTGHPQNLHPLRLSDARRYPLSARSGCGRSSHPHLHQDRRRRHDRARRHVAGAQDRSARGRVRRLRRDERGARRGARARRAARADRRRAAGRSRTTCSTSAPTCARPSVPDPEYPPLRVEESYVTRLEGWCDEFNADLPKLDSFILPGGTPGAALLHQARTLARRAERSAWAALRGRPRGHQPAGDAVPEPALRPAVHPRPVRQPRRRRQVGAWAANDELSTVRLVLMGVSGCGKSTVAGVLAGRLGWDFGEGDDLHPPENVAKMAAGHPLTDDDRWPWLERVAQWIREHTDAGRPGIITCSALKRSYRDILRGDHVVFVYLHGTREQIATRLAARHGHYMPAAAARLAVRDARTAGRGRARPVDRHWPAGRCSGGRNRGKARTRATALRRPSNAARRASRPTGTPTTRG